MVLIMANNTHEDEYHAMDFNAFDRIEKEEKESKKKPASQSKDKQQDKQEEINSKNPPGAIAGAVVDGLGVIATFIGGLLAVYSIVASRLTSSDRWSGFGLAMIVVGSGIALISVGSIVTNMAEQILLSRKILSELKKLNKKLDE